MCSEPVARSEYDIVDAVVRAMKSAPEDAYWARRLLDLVRDPVVATQLRSQIVIAVRCWAAHDPSFFVHERYLSEQLAVWAWPMEALEELDARLCLDDSSLTHLVLGRLWLAARRPSEEMPELYARAARHLREVEPHLQIGAWHEAMCEALGVADPNELAVRARMLIGAAAPSARDRAVLAILRGAARAADWKLYDEHRRTYGSVDAQGGTRIDSELVRLDGERAEQSMVRSTVLPSFGRRRSVSVACVEPPRAAVGEAATVRPPSRPR